MRKINIIYGFLKEEFSSVLTFFYKYKKIQPQGLQQIFNRALSGKKLFCKVLKLQPIPEIIDVLGFV
jgi:hypothetical protein